MNIDQLNSVQDAVFADKAFWPKNDDGDHVTFCNMAAIAVAHGVNCQALDSPLGKQPLMADEIYRMVKSTPAVFSPLPMRDCQERVNAGALIFAILPSYKLQESHGHICTLATGPGDHSGRWNSFTPFCLNLGGVGTCFRRKGINWAFQVIPEFFAWTQTP